MRVTAKRMHRAGGLVAVACAAGAARAQPVLFEFDNAPLHAPLPVDVSAGGITAHLSATGQGFSIQQANTLGFTPAGFGGYCIYPSSASAADLLVGFSRALTQFSIMYAPQELGCDDSATMRVTAYLNGAFVATATTTAPMPGTWPTGLLSITTATGFNSVVVHYDHRPPTCQDWGAIFLADNMTVTPAPAACPGDANGDGVVNFTDLNIVLSNYGLSGPGIPGDVTGDGTVNFEDLNLVLSYYGVTC